MRNRPGERSRLEIRQAWRRTVRKNIPLWGSLFVLVALCLVVDWILPIPAAWRGFVAGFAVASSLACLAWMVVDLSGTHGRSLGKLGEEATAKAVSGWNQRRRGWRTVNGLFLAGHGDVDLILVGPGGVFAFESKWSSSPCRIEQGRITGLLGREPVAQARDGARKIERLLRHGPERFDVTVSPVVVIWGPHTLNLERGWTVVDGVLVCEGRHKKSWIRQLSGYTIEPAEVEAISCVLDKQVVRQVDQPANWSKNTSSTSHL